MSDNLIKRSDAIKAIRKLPNAGIRWTISAELVFDALLNVPSADRPWGEWIDKGWKGDWQFETDGRGNCWYEYECSECGFRNREGKSNFCPNCGADMRKREGE